MESTMNQHIKSLMARTITSAVAGAALGSVGVGVFALLCPGVYWIIGGQSGQVLSFIMSLLPIGAVVGAAAGLCLALDWNDEKSEPDTVPNERTEVRARMPVPRDIKPVPRFSRSLYSAVRGDGQRRPRPPRTWPASTGGKHTVMNPT
jgi:hypothetical protein